MSDQIDNFAPDGGVVDVTGGRVSFVMHYVKIDATEASDDLAIAQLDPKLAVFQLVPLSEQFDALWQGKPGLDGTPSVDENGRSQRDQTIDTVDKAIKDAVSSAFAFTNDIPTTGSLRAFAVKQHLFLSYKIAGCKVTFSVPVALGIDATADLTFDVEILIILGFQDWPHVKPIVSAGIGNLDISAASVAASVIEGLASVLGINIKSLLERVAPPSQSNPKLAQSIETLMQTIERAAVPAGFTSCTPDADGDKRLIHLVLDHPVDPAPQIRPAAVSGDGGLFQPVLGSDRVQVHAGDTVTLIGSNFPPDQATRAGVEWNDTVTGVVTRSELDISVNGAPANRVTVARQRLDTRNVFFATGLPPGTRVDISVRDCDALTCTPFSNTVAVTTSTLNGVDITLESGGVSVALPNSATVDASGAFSASVVVPARTAAGMHRLSAFVGAAFASVSITVLPEVQPVPRQLHQVDPITGQVVGTLVTPNQLVGVHGDGFPPGRATVVIELDTGGGVQLPVADVATDNEGSFTTQFTWPADSTGGAHTITALILNIPPEVGATLDVFVELPPR